MDDHKLWDLMGRSPRISCPPFLAAKVIRRIEALETRRTRFTSILRWLAPAAVAALLVIAVVPRPVAEPVTLNELTTLDLVEFLSPEDYETLAAAGWPYNNGFLSAGL